MSKQYVNIIGAGLAGCEAAWQVSRRGIDVRLYEMKPHKFSPAHSIDTFAELVCSNSLRSDRLENAVGLLKAEMRLMDSLIMRCADETRVPAGGALAVDRTRFSNLVTEYLVNEPKVEIIHEEVDKLPDDGVCIIATGPLTSDGFSKYISGLVSGDYLYFYDAAAPIVTYASIDMSKAFRASRYGKGEDDYINCPMDKEQYELFYREITNAEVVQMKEFEKEILFSGCMPIESMAGKGQDTMRYGPLKPVGLIDPVTGREPWAVVQLRQDNSDATLFNIVGFQTHLKWPEQKRVFGLIPGLENAEFARYGVMHRNTFIKSPGLLDKTYCMMSEPRIYFAGQITGVEGYIESASSGMVAGINAARKLLGKENAIFPASTATGALACYVSNSSVKDFQPMNINYGIMETPKVKIRNKVQKNVEISNKAIEEITEISGNL